MTAVVSVETVLLVVLVVLVTGLLRSHAEILRRLGDRESGTAEREREPGGQRGRGVPGPGSAGMGASRHHGRSAPGLAGVTPAGDPLALSFAGPATAPTLLAFLSSGCTTCAAFWENLDDGRLPAGIRPVVVTRGAERERPARVRSLAPANVPVVMSSQAWDEYGIPGAPYFVLVDQEVRGEGVATTWSALSSLVRDAVQDSNLSRGIDETLAASGIGPDDPSLYPAGKTQA